MFSIFLMNHEHLLKCFFYLMWMNLIYLLIYTQAYLIPPSLFPAMSAACALPSILIFSYLGIILLIRNVLLKCTDWKSNVFEILTLRTTNFMHLFQIFGVYFVLEEYFVPSFLPSFLVFFLFPSSYALFYNIILNVTLLHFNICTFKSGNRHLVG
jgi:hypothetical protein